MSDKSANFYPNASLVIVGSGIKFMSHLTTEAKAYIRNAGVVLYLVNDPAMKEWIEVNNQNAESLDKIYISHLLRRESYKAITEYILSVLRKHLHVCVVIYGHPTILAQPTLDAVVQARKEGYIAKAIPGLSAEDCLYADLLIDPGSCGSQSFEATDFLLRKRKFDPSSHLILFQIGYLGVFTHLEPVNKENAMNLLLDYLIIFYHHQHNIYLYEAAQYPTFDPRIDKLRLEQLPTATITAITTLYIPPAYPAMNDNNILKKLGI